MRFALLFLLLVINGPTFADCAIPGPCNFTTAASSYPISAAPAAPQGRLTLSPATPYMSADTVSSTLYYAPAKGNSAPLYDGAAMSMVQFTSGPTDAVGLPLPLAGRSALSQHQVFMAAGPKLCTVPMAGSSSSIIKYTDGVTAPGGMSAFAGSSAAFDGLTIQADAASAGSGSSVAGYAAVNSVGRIYPTARPLLRFRIFGTSDVGFRGDGVAIAFKIQGSNDDGVTRVDLYVGVTPAGAGAALDISSGIVGGNFTSFFVNLSGNGLGNWTRIAEAEFYGPDPVAVPAVILAPYNGFLTNAAAAPCQSATGSITCPPNQCTYLGAVRIGPNAGQAIAHFSYGPAREFDVWNFYNQTEIVLNAGLLASSAPCDALHPTCYIPGGSLVYPTPVWQVQNNNMGASLTVFTGVAQQPIVVKRNQNAWLEAPAGGSAQFTIAIGWNTTATWCGTWGQWDIEGLSILSRGGYSQSARCQIPPTAGAQTFYALDAVGAGVVRAWIGERDSTLTGKYRG